MPETKVRKPDGSIVTVRHPQGATKEQILQFAKSRFAPDMGKPDNVSAAGQLQAAASMISAIPGQAAGGVTGLATLAATQDPKAAAEVSGSVANSLTFKPGQEGQKGLQRVSEFVKPATDAIESVEKGLGNATLEATGSPLAATAAHMAPSVILDLLGAGAGYATVKAGGRGLQSVKKIDNAIQSHVQRQGFRLRDDMGNITPEAKRAIQTDPTITQIAESALTPDEARRLRLMVERDVEPIRPNVTQSADDWRDAQDAMKRSGPVADRVSSQDVRLRELAEEGIDNLTTAADLPEVNSNVFGAIDELVGSVDNQVNAAYKLARERGMADGRVVTADDLATVLRSNMSSDRASGGVLSAIRGEMQNKGLLDGLKMTNRRITVAEAEDLRIYMNQLWKEHPEGRRIINTMKDALDDDVATAIGGDIFADARLAKQQYQRMIERSRRNKRDRSSASLLEDIIYNKVPEDKIFTKLMNARDDDFASVKSILQETPRGQAAWNDIKGQVIREALDRAIGGAGQRGGTKIFNGRLFRKYMQKYRGTKKYNELFSAEERKLIEDIEEIASFRVPDVAVPQGSGPTGFMVSEVANQIPGVGQLKMIADLAKNWKTEQKLLNPLQGRAIPPAK